MEATPPSVARQYPVIPVSELLSTIAGTDRSRRKEPAAIARDWQFRFQLLCAFSCLQEVSTQRDVEWQKALESGALTQAIDAGFWCPDSATVHQQTQVQDLRAMLAVLGLYR